MRANAARNLRRVSRVLSADAKARRYRSSNIVHLNALHPRMRRTAPEETLQLCQHGVAAACDDLDPAVRQISCMPVDTEFARALSRGGAKAHALHMAAHEVASSCHGLAQSAVLASIIFSRSARVTGPMKLSRRLPSGAIKCVVGRPLGTEKAAGGA